MNRYKVTFIVTTDEDPSSILDAAHETAPTLADIISNISDCPADIDDDDTSVCPATWILTPPAI